MPEHSENPSKPTPRIKTTAPARAILTVACDTACGIALILIACLFAGFLRRLIPLEYPDLYIVWFTIGMIPFVWFAHWRRAVTFTWRDVVVLAPLLLIWPFVPMTVFDGPAGWVFYPVAIVCVLWLGERLSARILPESLRSKTRKE
ncbi:MAG: hypothetical protein GXX96_15820 [Planctomycetaceae bacterium]|nr:hypothetical protein [Planctomycetaceae bacterium]